MSDGSSARAAHVAPTTTALDAMLCFDLSASSTISAVYRPVLTRLRLTYPQ